MDFGFNDEYKMIQKMYREFAEKEIKPLAEEIDENERFPKESVQKMAENGMLGIPFPEEYGGEEGDYLSYVIAVEELSKVCASTGVTLSAHTSLCAAPIYDWGTEEQKQKYLTPMASGDCLGAFGLTEPNAGTDASRQKTIAVKKGDHYVLNGSKCFITNAGEAGVYVVMAMTDKEKGNHGISAFIVEDGFEGFSIGKHEKKMGIRGSATASLIFEDCIVPEENLLGREGEGFKIAMHTLDGGRIGIAAQALGIAEGALNEAVAYVKLREQFGKPLAAFQNTQFVIAGLANRVEAARMLVYRAAWAKDNHLPYSVESAHAKLYAAETAMYVTTECVQLLGGYGYTREYPVERMMRDAKITQIYEGTSEVQKMVISRSLLK
ncbi:MAG: acyl-CoA dehydrogenase [Stomatobaculum sp.]